jgi:hypothetical protein
MEQYIDHFREIDIRETIKELSEQGYSVHKYSSCLAINCAEPLSYLLELAGTFNHLSMCHEKDDIDLDDYLVLFANPKLLGSILFWPEIVWPKGFKL